MKYFVRIGDAEHEITIEGDTVAIDGQTLRAHAEDIASTPITAVTIGSEVHRVVARRGEGKGNFDVSVAGFRFAVEALDDRTRTIRRMAGASSQKKGPVHLHAPMPGLVVRVNVAVGDEVHPGQGLVVMEAMKMENELRATARGRVKRVVVEPGSAVEKGALLLEMEEDL